MTLFEPLDLAKPEAIYLVLDVCSMRQKISFFA